MKRVWDFPFAVASDKTVDVIIAETRADALREAEQICLRLGSLPCAHAIQALREGLLDETC